MQQISKRAATLDALKDAIISLWDTNAGPFKNIFGLFTSFIPFVPGLGWTAFIIEKVASFLGIGLAELGAFIDGELGLGPGSDVTAEHADNVVASIIRALTVKSAGYNKEEIRKLAFPFGIKQLVSKVPFISTWIWRLIRMLVLALGVNKVSEIYHKVEEARYGFVEEKPNLFKQFLQSKPEANTNKENKDESGASPLSNFDVRKIKDFFTDPSSVINITKQMFGP